MRSGRSIRDANSIKVSSFKREHKTAQTLSIVVGGFVACWLPFFCVYLANPFLPSGTIPPLLTVFLTWLGECHPLLVAASHSPIRVVARFASLRSPLPAQRLRTPAPTRPASRTPFRRSQLSSLSLRSSRKMAKAAERRGARLTNRRY